MTWAALQKTKNTGLAHDAFTYGAALEACGRTGNWQKAESIVEQMADAHADSVGLFESNGSIGSGIGIGIGSAAGPSLAPTAIHCNAVLQAYSRGKRCVARLCVCSLGSSLARRSL